jgi:hypothetical protein
MPPLTAGESYLFIDLVDFVSKQSTGILNFAIDFFEDFPVKKFCIGAVQSGPPQASKENQLSHVRTIAGVL